MTTIANSDAVAHAVQRRPSSYIPGLDGMRAIAFLMVFGAHATSGYYGQFVPATLGVTIFFFLSGYLICTLLRKELIATGTISLRDFYVRRTLRIFVPLVIVYIATALFDRYVMHAEAGNVRGALSALFYVYNYLLMVGRAIYIPKGMDVIWSLGVEEHFYILFPLVLILFWRARMPLARQVRYLTAFCVLSLLWRCFVITFLHLPNTWTYFATDSRLDSILWGCILALRHNQVFGESSVVPRRWEFAAFVAAVFGLGLTLLPGTYFYKFTFRFTLQSLCLYIIFSFVMRHIEHPSVRWLEWTPLRYVGWISYVLYLCHKPLVEAAIYLCPQHWLPRTLLALALSVAFATVVRYTVELPLQKLRARFRHVAEADPRAADGHGLVS